MQKMLNGKKCTLYVYKGHLGLPSVDHKCLQALLLVQSKSRHKVEIKSSGFYITPHFPMLEYNGNFYTTQADILKKLQLILGHTDTENNVKKSRIEAYKALTYQTLEPCITLSFWGNDKNCQYLLKMYGSEKYFPFSLIYLRRLNIHVRNLVTQYVNELLNESGTAEMHETLESYLTDISHLLTHNKFLLGDSPSSLDAYVCGYLAPIYALNLPDRTLKTTVQKYDVVVKYLLNYLKHYNIKLVQEPSSTSIPDPDDNDRASLGLLATAGFIALSLMISYGIVNDVFKMK